MSSNFNLICANVAAASRSLNARPKQSGSFSVKGRICTLLSQLPLPSSFKNKLREQSSQFKQPMRAILPQPQWLKNASMALMKVVSRSIGDEVGRRQAVESLFCSIYSTRKDEVGQLYADLNQKIPLGYLYEIGQAAEEMNLPCTKKDDYLVPNGAGADIFTNFLSGEILKAMPEQHGQSFHEKNYQSIAKRIAFDVVGNLTEQKSRAEAFSNKLAKIGVKYAPIQNNSDRL